MRVLHITARADHGGGPEHIYQLIKHSPPHVTHFVASPDDHPYAGRFQQLTQGRHFQIPHRKFSTATLIGLTRWASTESIDLIHSHGKGAGIYSRAMKIALPVTVVHTFHGIHQNSLNHIQWLLYLKLERLLAAVSDGLIAVSKSEQAMIESFNIAKRPKLRAINNGVEIPKPARNVTMPCNPMRIIAVTRFEHQKNPQQLVEITSLLEKQQPGNFSLLILGEGHLLESCQQLARNRGLADTIQFAGAVDDVREHLREADVFLSTSLGEGLPIAPLEAMSEQLPCVLSDVRGHHELLNEKEVGYLYPLDRSDLATDHLIRLLRNPFERANRGENAYHYANNNYNVNKMAQKTVELYEKLTSA